MEVESVGENKKPVFFISNLRSILLWDFSSSQNYFHLLWKKYAVVNWKVLPSNEPNEEIKGSF